ncbi:hypothetical protein [Streptomyces sp. NPDC057854]|uniref:hypothetical protein n=1 Tax=unclassified Streptomyces TaxID=2593676 RepID=UPI00368BB4EC
MQAASRAGVGIRHVGDMSLKTCSGNVAKPPGGGVFSVGVPKSDDRNTARFTFAT